MTDKIVKTERDRINLKYSKTVFGSKTPRNQWLAKRRFGNI